SPAHLANNDPVRAHTEGVPEQLPDSDFALALRVWWPALKPDHVLLLDLQFRGVLNSDDPIVVRNEGRQDIQQRSFAGSGTAGNNNVQFRFDTGVQQFGDFRGQRAEIDQVSDGQGHFAEFADCQGRT